MEPFSAVLRIILIDLALSGDNAVVIGMAAHRLPPRQRRVAIVVGGLAAIVLRIVLTATVVYLLTLPGLRLVGGALLIWIAFKLLAEEEESHEGIKVATSLKEAIVTILIADFVMSLDNVIAVAQASGGSVILLMFGLVFSMAILMFMGSLVANLINRFWWLAYLGSAVIAWTGTLAVFEEPFVNRHLHTAEIARYSAAGVITVATLLFAHWFHRVREKA
jgi:YjbE family integral membrane protein